VYLILIIVDADSIPTINILQGGLLNDEGYLREFFLFVKRLLKCATVDPGFVNAKEVGFISCSVINSALTQTRYV